MNNVILSGKYPIFTRKLIDLGYHVIHSEILPQLIPYEQDHADMQCLILDDTAFVLQECTRLADRLRSHYQIVLTERPVKGAYPSNVCLNAAAIGKNVIARLASLDEKVRSYCLKHGYHLINVNQGYTKCSCAIVSDNALITADRGIYHSLKEYKEIDTLLIEQGRVALCGAEYGFIGGASGLDIRSGEKNLYFTGDVRQHPGYNRIKSFCESHDTKICSLTDTELTDIGGLIFC